MLSEMKIKYKINLRLLLHFRMIKIDERLMNRTATSLSCYQEVAVRVDTSAWPSPFLLAIDKGGTRRALA
jgi:hypothetical protein